MNDDEIQFRLNAEEPQKLTKWKKEPDILALKGDLEAAKPSHSIQIDKIKRWNDLLRVEDSAKPQTIPGRSKVQPKLIRKQAEWRYSALTEALLSSGKTFQVSPVTFEDEPAARQNEQLLNYQFENKINRVKFIDDYVRSVTDDGTAFVRVGWHLKTELVTTMAPIWEFYPIESEEQMMALQQAVELKSADPRTFNEQVDPALQAAVEHLEETGQATYAELVGEEEIEEENIIENHPTVEVVDPANVYVDPSCKGDLDKALFVIYTFETNKAELQEEGRYQNLDLVTWDDSAPMMEPDHETQTPQDFQFKDELRKKVVAYEYWGYYDIHGDGALHPIVATWIGDTIIRMEENPFPGGFLPFVAVPYLPRKRELYGEPDAELLEDNQQILGAVMRGLIDLMGRSANGQQGFAKGMLDGVNRRRFLEGRDYEFNPNIPPQQGLIEHKYPEAPRSAMEMIALQNQEAESLTGVKSFSGGLSGEAYGKVATGIRGMLDAASKREMAILRRLASGLIRIGKRIIAMNAEFLTDTEVVRVTNEEYVTIQREDLRGNFDLKVDISTFEVDNEKAQELAFMLQTLGPNMDPMIYMRILAEIADLKRMPVLSHEFRTWQPQPDPVAEQLKQLELLKVQKEVEKLESEIQLNLARARQSMADAGLTELDKMEQELGVKHARNVVERQAQAKGNQDLELVKAAVKPRKVDEIPGDIGAGVGMSAMLNALNEQQLLGDQDEPVPHNPNVPY